MSMSKFLDLIRANLPQADKPEVLPKQKGPRFQPRPSKGANAPMEISKVSRNTQNPVADKVKGLLSLLFDNDINAQQTQPDAIKIKTPNGNVLVKVIADEESESIMKLNKDVAEDETALPQQQAELVDKQFQAVQPKIVSTAAATVKNLQADLVKQQQIAQQNK